jgi:hypothetical protein
VVSAAVDLHQQLERLELDVRVSNAVTGRHGCVAGPPGDAGRPEQLMGSSFRV